MDNKTDLKNIWENPVGTDGFGFLEFATSKPQELAQQFFDLGFRAIAKHKAADITIYQQNNIRFLINAQPNTKATQFAGIHGNSVSAMGFRVQDVNAAVSKVIAKGARRYTAATPAQELNLPAIYGVGDSLIYFIEHDANIEDNNQFTALPASAPSNIQLDHIDHVTHNLFRGQLNVWGKFYEDLFNFREIRYFDIEGKLTGLRSRAMTSPCGKIRIPLNESSDDKSQIEEFLADYNGEGIQHIALATLGIYDSIEALRANQIQFLETPATYYKKIDTRLPNHGEDLARLEKNHILIDGNTVDSAKLLLQIFTKNMLGPVFFEIIQRKGDEGFGEGNFRALFESIEEDQVRRGVLSAPA